MKKLKLNKKTIIDLSSSEMNNLKGGAPSLVPWECQSLFESACPDTNKPDNPEPAETENQNDCPQAITEGIICASATIGTTVLTK